MSAPCPHDYENPVRKGRAHYVCRLCGVDISMDLFFIWQADEEAGQRAAQPKKGLSKNPEEG